MYKIYCDGASRSNPGEASIGVSVTKEGNDCLLYTSPSPRD